MQAFGRQPEGWHDRTSAVGSRVNNRQRSGTNSPLLRKVPTWSRQDAMTSSSVAAISSSFF